MLLAATPRCVDNGPARGPARGLALTLALTLALALALALARSPEAVELAPHEEAATVTSLVLRFVNALPEPLFTLRLAAEASRDGMSCKDLASEPL